jgi:hypothetical protein
MTLTILRFCLAIYAPDATSPEIETCFNFSRPVRYDVRSCPGEVITDRWPAPTLARCEIKREE